MSVIVVCRWVERKPLMHTRCHASLVVVGRRMFLVGGRTKDEDTGSVYSIGSILQYDELADEWFHVSAMLYPRHDFGCSVLGTCGHVSAMLYPRHDFGCSVLGA